MELISYHDDRELMECNASSFRDHRLGFYGVPQRFFLFHFCSFMLVMVEPIAYCIVSSQKRNDRMNGNYITEDSTIELTKVVGEFTKP